MHVLHVATPPYTMCHFAASISVEAIVRGYHVYKDTWATVVGEELPCQHEDGNRADSFAVAVVRRGNRWPRSEEFALSIYAGAAQSFVE